MSGLRCALVASALCCACAVPAGEPAARAAPAVEVGGQVRYGVCSLLGDGRSGEGAADDGALADAPLVVVTVLALPELPRAVGRPIGELAAAVVSVSDPQGPLLAAPTLCAGARAAWLPSGASLRSWLEAGRAGPARVLARLRAVLAPGVAATFTPASAAGGGVRLSLRASAAGAIAAVIAVERPPGDAPGAAAGAHEAVLLGPQALQRGRIGLAALVAPGGPGRGALALVAEVVAPPLSGALAGLHTRARSEWRLASRASDSAGERLGLPGDSPDSQGPAAVAWASLDRDALAWELAQVARAAGARLAYAVALAGDASALDELAARLARLPGDPVTGLTLERAAVWVTTRAGAEERLVSLRILHAGAVGVLPARLRACATQAADLADLDRRVRAGNLALREHPEARVRSRARAWLAAAEGGP